MRKKNAKRKNGSYMMIAGIVAMNILGIGYAYWSDSLSIKASVSTGFIDPCFNWTEDISTIVGLSVDYYDHNHVMEIKNTDGTVMEEGDTLTLRIPVENRGTVPFEFENLKEYDPGEIANVRILDDGQIELEINAREAGTHEFEFEITYESK